MKNKFREFFKHRQRKRYLRVSTPVIHYFKSKKTQKVSRAFNRFLQVLIMQIMQSLPVEASRPAPEQGKVQLVPYQGQLQWYAFLFLSIRVFGSIWKYRMQWFSWRTCTARAAGAEARTPRGVRGHAPPGKFVKLDSLKCNFLRSGPELGNRNYDRNHLCFFRL